MLFEVYSGNWTLDTAVFGSSNIVRPTLCPSPPHPLMLLVQLLSALLVLQSTALSILPLTFELLLKLLEPLLGSQRLQGA